MDPDFSVSDETDYRYGTDIEDGIYNIYGTVNFGEHLKFRDPEAMAADVKKKLESHYEKLLKEFPTMQVVVLGYRIEEGDESPADWWLDYSLEDKDGNEDVNRRARDFLKSQ